MYVFELVQPGAWLQGFDDTRSRSDVESLLRLLTGCVEDAAIALTMFEQSHGERMPSAGLITSWEADRERERVIEERLLAALPPDLPVEERCRATDDLREAARREAKRQKWREGAIPDTYGRRIPFLHAKTFLYALDSLQKALAQLAVIPGVPSVVADVCREFDQAVPDLRHVRDSSHHAEDRVQGKRYKTRIELKPVINGAIHAPGGGVLVVDMLNGNRYGGTLGDGSYGEVEVGPDTVASAQFSVQRVLDCLEWRGPAEHLPS